MISRKLKYSHSPHATFSICSVNPFEL